MGYVVKAPPTVGVPVHGSSDLFPVRRIFCVGRNYAAHAREMGHDPDREPPFFFMKPASTCIVGPGDLVRIPRGCQVFDWEVEVVVVFGRGGRDISQSDAMSHVAGYSIGIDFTASNGNAKSKMSSHFFGPTN